LPPDRTALVCAGRKMGVVIGAPAGVADALIGAPVDDFVEGASDGDGDRRAPVGDGAAWLPALGI
jgi:hypothetical protein